MTFKQTLERIESSKVFKKFKQEFPDAKFCAGFFILDFLSNDNKRTLDYKGDDRIFTFSLDAHDEIVMLEDKLLKGSGHPPLQELKSEVGVEPDELKSIAGMHALDEGVAEKFQKIIAVLQKHEGRQIWNLTCLLEQLIILNVLIDSDNGEIIKFEKKSMMDFIKKK